MRFQLPLFIGRETKIVGPLTFKQFLFIGIAVGIILVLYFTLGKINFLLFLLSAVILMGGALALAFVNVAGKSLPSLVGNFFVFLVTSRVYLWKKKKVSPKLIKLEKKPESKVKEAPVLKIAERSQLKKLSTQIETRTK